MAPSWLISTVYAWICGFHCRASAASQFLSLSEYQIEHIPDLKTIFDFRGPYRFGEPYNLRGTVHMQEALEIEFDIKLPFVNSNTSSLWKLPLFYFVSPSAHMQIFLDENGEIFIVHRRRNFAAGSGTHGWSTWTTLLQADLFTIPMRARQPIIENPAAYQHFKIQMTNKNKIILEVNGFVTERAIDRDICPAEELMLVCLDRESTKVKNGLVHYLIIRVC